MKKFIKTALVFILALAVLCGCADDTSTAEVISDLPEGAWERDFAEHWKTDENGEIVYSGEHEIDDFWLCTVCGCEIIDWGDESYDINDYDEYGNVVRNTSYENGEVICERVNEYEYDDAGNILSAVFYENGELWMEEKFIINSDGDSVLQEAKTYLEEGGYSIESFDENSDNMSYVVYDENENVVFESVYEYKFTSDGDSYLFKDFSTDYETGEKYEYTYNEMGDQISYTEYDSSDAVVYTETEEYEYDDQDRRTYHKTVVNGILTEEIFFAYHEDDDGWWSYYDKQILYNEDGSYTVYRYDENDELLSEESFDANGNKQ